jgi:hypothetical protein
MEQELSWITYWYQVSITSIDWVLVYYPIQTIIFGVVVTVAMVIGFVLRGQKAEAGNILWGSFFGLVACCASFIILVLCFGPYLHLQQREKEIKSAAKVQYDAMEKSKNDQIKILNDTVAVLGGSQKTLQDKQQMAKDMREKRDAKLCFHSPLAFTQTRLENFQTPSTINFEYAKEILIKPFSFSGPTTLRIHVDGGVSWFHTTPRDKEFERFNGGVGGHDYVEVPVSSKVLEEKHWSITLYGEKPFDVICIDKLPKKPNQAAIPVKPKEKIADILIRKYPGTDPTLERLPKLFVQEWLNVIHRVNDGMTKHDLQTVLKIRPQLRDHISEGAHLAEAIFTLHGLQSEGYMRITETPERIMGYPGVVNNLEFEFVPERLDEFKAGL